MANTQATHIPEAQIDALTASREAAIVELAAAERRYRAITTDLQTAELDRLFVELDPHLRAVTYAPDKLADLVLGPEPTPGGEEPSWNTDQGRIDLDALVNLDPATIEQIFTLEGKPQSELTRAQVAEKTRELAQRLTASPTKSNSAQIINQALEAQRMNWALAVHQARTPEQRELAERRHDELLDVLAARGQRPAAAVLARA
jgi:hypothetical protein